jgi:hypothetical protein
MSDGQSDIDFGEEEEAAAWLQPLGLSPAAERFLGLSSERATEVSAEDRH